jgi:hypothetical protein
MSKSPREDSFFGERSRLVQIAVTIDETFLTEYNADGLIIATATGSTAYSLSAGGPIVTPNSGVFVVTPICPHVLTNRSVVVADSSMIHLKPSRGDQPKERLLIGHSCDLKPPNLLPIFAYCGAGIVPIISPGRVTKMDDEITVVRGHTIAETDVANGLPVGNGLSLTLGKKNKP